MTQIRETNPDNLYPLLHKTLRHWYKADASADSSRIKSELSQLFRSETNGRENLAKSIIEKGLTLLAEKEPRSEQILRWRFWDKQTIQFVANQLGISVDSANREQRRAIHDLAVLLADCENKLRAEKFTQLEAKLPPPTYSTLFGHQTVKEQLTAAMLQSQSPWVVSVVGLGGIGKTAVTDSVVRHLLGHFVYQHILWVRVEANTMHGRSLSPQHTWEKILSSLHEALQLSSQPLSPEQLETHIRLKVKAEPYLIVIDNLEDESSANFLFSKLADWGNPSKFIVTSRVRPMSQQTILAYSLNELSQAESLAFIRYEARQRGLTEIESANDDQLLPIFDATGGHPLALKLTIGLTAVMPLPTILNDLSASHLAPIQEMYTHIYWKTWQALSADARHLLEAMPLVGISGAKPEQMQAMCQLDDTQLWAAIHELVARSMLEVRGSVWERRYGIHPLTESFLQTEIINWPSQPKSHD